MFPRYVRREVEDTMLRSSLKEYKQDYEQAVDALKALMYRFHPAGQQLEPEGKQVDEQKAFEEAIKVIKKHKERHAGVQPL